MTTTATLDAAGRRRSPATYHYYLAGRPPKNKGRRYPADPPRVEEIMAVMRRAGERPTGLRLRGLIVVLWRAGLRISEALALAEGDLEPGRGAMLVRRGKGGRRRWRWTSGAGSSCALGSSTASSYPSDRSSASSGPDRGSAVVTAIGADAVSAPRAAGRGAPALCPASAPPRPRGGDGARRCRST